MKRIVAFLLLCAAGAYAQTNTAFLSWEVYGCQYYRIDIKTNLTDNWYPYAVVQLTHTNTVTPDMHLPASVPVPASPKSGFYRLYTQPDYTNGFIWPTTNSQNVAFTVTPPVL